MRRYSAVFTAVRSSSDAQFLVAEFQIVLCDFAVSEGGPVFVWLSWLLFGAEFDQFEPHR